MKTAVEAIFVGKERQYNRRFLQMCSHHLIEPVACTPASGWEKGQVENQAGNLRDQMFRPIPRVKSRAELNAWLEDQCIAYAKRTKHPEFKDRTVWDVFQEERASLMKLRGPFDGFVEKAVRASTTCLIMADHNRYSVDARAAGRMVLVRSYAERIVVLFDDEMVADHPRQFRRDQIICDPWHYLPVLMKKPGALRNGAPFKDWDLPPALTQVRIKLKQHADGDRQFVTYPRGCTGASHGRHASAPDRARRPWVPPMHYVVKSIRSVGVGIGRERGSRLEANGQPPVSQRSALDGALRRPMAQLAFPAWGLPYGQAALLPLDRDGRPGGYVRGAGARSRYGMADDRLNHRAGASASRRSAAEKRGRVPRAWAAPAAV